jgi:hypothetical protein
LLALILAGTGLTITATIGLILLIGIVKKNAIMMIDFVIAEDRQSGKNTRDAIYDACMPRPILMTMAAGPGALRDRHRFGTAAAARGSKTKRAPEANSAAGNCEAARVNRIALERAHPPNKKGATF